MKTNSTHLTLALFFCVFVQAVAFSGPNAFDVPKGEAEKIKAKVNSGEFSLSSFAFVENKGQVYGFDGLPHPEVKFSLQQGNTQIFLLEKGIAYQFTKIHYPEGYQEMMRDKDGKQDMEKMMELQKQIRTETYRMDMTLVGANKAAEITTEGRSTDYTNYYNHNVLEVFSYSKITYHEVYPGIDWVVYVKNNKVKYDFVVRPGADPTLIKMQFDHQEKLSLKEDGSFTLRNSMGNITEKRPISFQAGKEILSSFVLKNNILSFKLENYLKDQTLIIDPAVGWATYYGGNAFDVGFACAVDASNNVYLAGQTQSNGSIASGGHQNTFGSGADAYLVKFNSSGVRQWASYYGGTGYESGASCANDASGNVYLAGNTQSTAGIASGGHQNTYGGGAYDAFLVKFNSSGIRQWATYYGASTEDLGFSCTTDPSSNVYLAGRTESSSGISSAGHQNTFGGGLADAYLVKFSALGVRQWCTYYGGAGAEDGNYCSSDASGNVYLTGSSSSTANIASGGHQNTIVGSSCAYLVKFNGAGLRQWGTYYGGNGQNTGHSCATDGSGNVYMAGATDALANISSGGHQNTFGGWADAFLVKFNGLGIRQWGTYYGGTSSDQGRCCFTDVSGNVYLSGVTQSTAGIASGGYQNTYGGSTGDAFLVKFSGLGLRQWGSYYGNTGYEYGYSGSSDNLGNLYLAGYTDSGSGIASGGHQNSFGGGSNDAFLVKFCDIPAQPTAINGNTVVCLGSNQSYSISVVSSALSYSWSLPATGWSGVSTTNSITAIVGSSGTISVTAINACGASVQQTISITSNPSPVITVNSGSICQGASFTIAPSGALSYTIEGGVAVVSPSTSITYTVSGTNSLGCVSQSPATSSVNVFSLPNVSINGTVATICEGEELTLNASGASNYTWSTGANTASINIAPITTTTYSIIGTDANGCANVALVSQAVDPCVGLQELPLKNEQHSVFPNPHDGLFYIETSQSLGVSIYNSLGQLILQRKLNEGKNQINLNEHANGIYFIEINQNGKTNRMKLIKE